MGKKKAAGGLAEGVRVRIKPGVVSPEFPELEIGGWTGTVSESSGKSPNVKYIVEWDEPTMARMPAEYVRRCEEQNLYYRMVCLGGDDLEAADGAAG